jgi:hypothetical protein
LRGFAVKHVAKEQGPLVSILKTAQEQPYSYTSKKREAFAAVGCKIYVIEVVVVSQRREYRLGYCYKADEYHCSAGGTRWKGRFKFKNVAKAGLDPEGVYFEAPVIITDPDFNEWYKSVQGMTEIPNRHLVTLESIISNPANKAKPF